MSDRSRPIAHPWGCGERIACPWGCRGWGDYRPAEILRNGDVLAHCCGRRGRWHELTLPLDDRRLGGAAA